MNRLRIFLNFVCGLVLCLLLVACNLPSLPALLNPPTETPLPTPTAAPESNETPTPTIEVIEISIETEPAPTKTPPDPTATPTETLPPKELEQNGPWLVFSAVDGIWVINPDGSALTRLTADIANSYHSLKEGAAPEGANLAYITSRKDWYELSLKLVSLPGSEPVTLTALTSPDTEPATSVDSERKLPEAVRSLLQGPIMAWSPDGAYLAFTGAMGTSSDLYLYSVKDQDIVQLTGGATQVLNPIWSPDGANIIYMGVRSLGDENGYVQMDMWTARPETGDTIWLYKPEKSGKEIFLGWLDDTNFLVYSWNTDGLSNLRKVDIEAIKVEPVWEDKFTAVAYDPESKKVLLVLGSSEAAGEEQGLFLLDPTGGDRTFISIEDASTADWIPEAGYFSLSTPNGKVMLSPQGDYFRMQVSELGQLIAAPDGKRLGWYGSGGLLIGEVKKLSQEPPQQFYKSPVTSAIWAPDSETVFFFSLAGFYMVQPPYDNPILLEPGIASQDLAWVYP